MVKKVLSYIFYILCGVFILLLMGFYIYNSQKERNLKFFSYGAYIVTSSSMEPELSPYDFLIVSQEKNLMLGDIIVFRKNNEITTHRIVMIYEENGAEKYITKGDNNSSNDEGSLEKGNIIGKVRFSLPYAGAVFSFLETPKGILLCIILPSFILFLYYFQKVIYDFNIHKNKKENILRR